MFAKPQVGSTISVTTKYKDYYIYRTSDWRLNTYEGKVLASERYDGPNTFRMTGDARHPVRVISLHVVENLSVGGKMGVRQGDPNEKTVVVKGSKGNEYVVTINANGSGSCTCPAHVYRRMQCKHIKEVSKM